MHHPLSCALTLLIVLSCYTSGSEGQLFNLFGLTVTSNKVKLPIGVTASDYLSTYGDAKVTMSGHLLNSSAKKKGKKSHNSNISGCTCPPGDGMPGQGSDTSPDYEEMRHLIGGNLFS